MVTLGIDVENLKYCYGKSIALKDISFSLSGGKIYGLLGRNGAGKTTLLSILAAFRKPTAGKVAVNGDDPFENYRLTSQIIFIREKNQDEESDKVKEVLKAMQTFRPDWDPSYAQKLVQRFNLPIKKSVSELSRGMKSVMGMVIGLASRAPVTIFDETHTGVDAPSRHIFYEELLEDYMRHPRTIILSSHLIGEIASYLEEVVILDRGSIVLHQKTEDLLEKGFSVSGPRAIVDSLISELNVLEQKTLGDNKSAIIFGEFKKEKREIAEEKGLQIHSVELQDLFIHLTGRGDETHE